MYTLFTLSVYRDSTYLSFAFPYYPSVMNYCLFTVFWVGSNDRPRLACNSLCSTGWPETLDLPASVSQILALQLCASMSAIYLPHSLLFLYFSHGPCCSGTTPSSEPCSSKIPELGVRRKGAEGKENSAKTWPATRQPLTAPALTSMLKSTHQSYTTVAARPRFLWSLNHIRGLLSTQDATWALWGV